MLNSGQSLPSFSSTVRVCHNLGESTDNVIGKRKLNPPEEREPRPPSLRPYLIYLALNRVHKLCLRCVYAVYTKNTRRVLLQVYTTRFAKRFRRYAF